MADHPATQKLYLDDPYAAKFRAAVLECREDGDTYVVVLDRSALYPDSGGQLCDRGTIAEATVTEVWEDDGGVVYHRVDRNVDGEVDGAVDWQRRFDHMQQHTGQHVLSRAFIDVANLETISFHMGEDYCSIDLSGGEPDDEVLRATETLANRIISEGRAVQVRNVAPGDVDEPMLRKAVPGDVDVIRLVDIADFDVIGCCGTHVRNAGELGVIKILKHEKSKGAARVQFKVGARALDDYRLKHDIVKDLANRFTTSVDALGEKVAKLHSEGHASRKEVQRLSRRLAEHEAADLVASAVDCGAYQLVTAVVEDGGDDYVRALASALKARPHLLSIVAGASGLVVCNAGKGVDIDVATPVMEKANAVGARGGGKGGFATVSLATAKDATEFVEDISMLFKATG